MIPHSKRQLYNICWSSWRWPDNSGDAVRHLVRFYCFASALKVSLQAGVSTVLVSCATRMRSLRDLSPFRVDDLILDFGLDCAPERFEMMIDTDRDVFLSLCAYGYCIFLDGLMNKNVLHLRFVHGQRVVLHLKSCLIKYNVISENTKTMKVVMQNKNE